VAFSVLILTGEGTLFAQRVEKEGAEWLAKYSEPAGANVSGRYAEPSFDQITLEQAQGSREVKGAGDNWSISGVVSGNKVYLLFYNSFGKRIVYYCAELDIESDTKLTGRYSNGIMKPKSKTRPLKMTKVGPA